MGQAFIRDVAENVCPSLFISNGDDQATVGGAGLAMYTECGGNINHLLSKGRSCDVPQVPYTLDPRYRASSGSCNSSALGHLESGQSCEMTCPTGQCVEGRQPQCYDGHLINTMRCTMQSVQTCQFPPNSGCDPRTTCTQSHLFGTKLVQCSACPAGWYGSGRKGCYDINECTVLKNGGCDEHSTCSNFDGGYKCSPCEEAGLRGDPYKVKGCTSWPAVIQNLVDNPGHGVLFFLFIICLTAGCTAGLCQMCNKKKYKHTEGGFEKVDVGSIGTGPSIYDSTWAR